MNAEILTEKNITEPAASLPDGVGEEKKIYLFVCTGNTCRSPMAAAAANHFLRDRGILAVSAGLSVPYPAPMSRNALLALETRGIEPIAENDYRLHLSQPLTEELLRAADRVYGMTEDHSFMILTSFPEYSEKLFPLGVSIPDPYGGDEDRYLETLDAITDAVKKLYKRDNMEYRIELLPREELTAVSRLEREIFSDPWSYEALLSSYDNPCSVFFRAFDGGNNTVGYVVLYCMYDEAEILNVAVDPAARRMGMASALMTAAVEEGEKRGATAFFLEVRASNEPAIALYKKFGFVPIGVRKRYYSDPVEDAVEMRRG